MKKTTLLNAPISSAIAHLGHGDSICIGDAGLPVPDGVERIDIAVSAGSPSLLEVLAAVISEMFVERATISEELKKTQPELYARLLEVFSELEVSQDSSITVEAVKHEDFKIGTQDCRAVVRTGEFSRFANIILHSGVIF